MIKFMNDVGIYLMLMVSGYCICEIAKVENIWWWIFFIGCCLSYVSKRWNN